MAAFRTLLLAMCAAISVYTEAVVANHGLGLLPVFFRDIGQMGWPGQFNLDFLGFLMLSALWLAWRHHFKPVGIALGLLGFFGGIPFLSVYLFVASYAAGDDIRVLLLGPARAAPLAGTMR
jgi:hypothetical protein